MFIYVYFTFYYRTFQEQFNGVFNQSTNGKKDVDQILVRYVCLQSE